MIDAGTLSIRNSSNKPKDTQPSITNNPLPNHKPAVSINNISLSHNEIDPTRLMDQINPNANDIFFDENYKCFMYDYSTQEKVKIMPYEGLDIISSKDPFSDICATLDYDGAFFMLDCDLDEDASSVMSIVERNTGGHLTTPQNFQRPICLDDHSDGEEVSVAHLTRAGRHFKPSYLEDDNPLDALLRKEKGKGPMAEETSEEDDAIKRMKEVNSNISIWKLLMHSQPHRTAVIRHLHEASIDASITPDQVVGLIHGVDRTLMFTNDDLLENADHNYSLHITVECNGWSILKVLIDNGSAINVCPYRSLKKLGHSKEDLTPSNQVVKAYDNAWRNVLGSIELLLEYGFVARNVEFVVIDIEACFNLLLGRPWLHENNVIASTLHQKVKFLSDQGVGTIKGDPSDTSISHIGKSILHLDEEEDTRVDGFSIYSVQVEDPEEDSEEDPEEDLAENMEEELGNPENNTQDRDDTA
ncbi:uncharacterized protein [Spinacia oleracea]|uniref:Aspartic peptidase DDI1-type domain-containing protein n=1 Tax=Spinacia oleracea TaxID=3562 RepID=A0ABM3R2Q3_SPIOL|nr:uncharacterized protein LOC130464355 [Spinacia oleracea]